MTHRLQALVRPPAERSLAERFRVALQVAEDGLEVQRARLRRDHPAYDDEEVEAALWAWVRSRPPLGEGCPGLRDAMYRFEK